MASRRFKEYSPHELVIQDTQSRAIPLPSSSSFQIIFEFTGAHLYRQWIIPRDSTTLEPWVRTWTELPPKTIHFNPSVTSERMYRALNRGLVDYGFSISDRRKLAKRAVEEAWNTDLVTSMSNNDQLHLHIDFTIIHRQVSNRNTNYRVDIRDLERDRGYTWTPDRSGLAFGQGIRYFGGAHPSYTMVPSSQASIESLRSEIIVDGNRGSCSICLEDFVVGCEGVCVPCSHIFHRDCIRRWLSTSHYCPVCRFQMPT